MADFDSLLARIGMQIEEMKKRIRSSRDRAGHHGAEASDEEAAKRPVDERDMESLHTRTENRQDEPVTRR